jgi:hypothetical protein
MRYARPLGIVLGFALLIFVGAGIYRAGIDLPPTPTVQPVVVEHGLAQGRRITGPSWRFDYDKVQTSPDGSLSDIEGVHHGILYRKGKPYLRMTAQHLSVNTVTNDFSATGAIHLETVDRVHPRELDTTAAVWTNASQVLTLARPVTIDDEGAKVVVANVTIDFRTGKSRAGPMEGTMRLKDIAP